MTLRRDFLAFTAGAVVARTVLPTVGHAAVVDPIAPHPDAVLLDACAEFDALTCAFCATDFGAEPGTPEAAFAEAEQHRIAEEQRLIVDAMCTMHPVTLDGHIARASTTVAWSPDLLRDPVPDTDKRLLHAMLRDLAGSAEA